MATRSNIYLKLREEDRTKQHKSACGLDVNPEGDQYLEVYCHFDGYPDGVGKVLKDMNMTYEDALKYILEGDRSVACTGGSYWKIRKEDVPPAATDVFTLEQEYAYLLEETEPGKPLKISCIDCDGPVELDE